jgi:thiamine pyrophosphokinase
LAARRQSDTTYARSHCPPIVKSEMTKDSHKALYDAVVVADGGLPSGGSLKALAKASRRVIALDGATDRLIVIGLWPHLIVGDLDSISPRALNSARRCQTTIIQLKEQETSDLEKGLRFCRRHRWRRIAVVGFLGSRLDHSLNASGVFLNFSDLEITLITSQSIGRILNGRLTASFPARLRSPISLMPLPVAKGVRLSGVRWPFRRRTLRQGGFVSLSNEAVESVVTVRQTSGCSVFVAERRRGQVFLACEIRTYA